MANARMTGQLVEPGSPDRDIDLGPAVENPQQRPHEYAADPILLAVCGVDESDPAAIAWRQRFRNQIPVERAAGHDDVRVVTGEDLSQDGRIRPNDVGLPDADQKLLAPSGFAQVIQPWNVFRNF